MDIERMTVAAGMRGRGATYASISRALGVHERTVRHWAKLPAFQYEVERVRSDLTPTPHGVFVQALTATKDNGSPDWQARLRAAEHLSAQEAVTLAADDADLFDVDSYA